MYMRKQEHTTQELLNERKWRKALRSIPADGRAFPFRINDANDINIVKVNAAQLNNKPGEVRRYTVVADYATSIVSIKVTNKDDA